MCAQPLCVRLLAFEAHIIVVLVYRIAGGVVVPLPAWNACVASSVPSYKPHFHYVSKNKPPPSGTKAYSKTLTTRDAAIRMCLANSACNGFTLSGGKYTLYKSSKLTESAGKVRNHERKP